MSDNGSIGRLVNRHRGNNSTDIKIMLGNKEDIRSIYGKKEEKGVSTYRNERNGSSLSLSRGRLRCLHRQGCAERN